MIRHTNLLISAVTDALQRVGCTRRERILIGVSGGIDSMVLLDILSKLIDSLVVVHCDHALRADSATDVAFVEEQAARRGCAFISRRCDVMSRVRTSGMSVEEAGRAVRYELFDELAADQGAGKVALGHHLDDQAETVLMRLLRGSGSTGLRGMVPLRDGVFLRPLLDVRRADIASYAVENELPFIEDETNADWRYLRNRVRGHLLPILRAYNPNIERALHRAAMLLQGEDDFIEKAAQDALNAVLVERSEDQIALDGPGFLDYHIAVQRRVLRLALRALSPRDLEYAQVDSILQIAREKRRTLQELSKGLRIQYWADCLLLRQGVESPLEMPVPIPGVTEVPQRKMSFRCQFAPAATFRDLHPRLGGQLVALDADRLGDRLLLRSAEAGDRFRPLGMRGYKKLSDFLIDQKHPRILRDKVLVLESKGEIAWVVGMRMSELFRVRPDSQQIAVIELCSTE
jgi:tRNA(Ile)-lysidine synthase